MQNMAETTKQVVDAVSVFTVIGSLSEVLPPIAALLTIIWTVIRIYETDSMKRLVGRDKGEGEG